MAGTDKRKQLLYLPEDMLLEIMREANRLDRSLSWTVQRAWCIARGDVQKFPAAEPGSATRAATHAAPRPERTESIIGDRDRSPQGQRMAPDLERARADAQLAEFLRGKFDRNVPA